MLSQGYYDHDEDLYARMRTNQIHLRLAGRTKKMSTDPKNSKKTQQQKSR